LRFRYFCKYNIIYILIIKYLIEISYQPFEDYNFLLFATLLKKRRTLINLKLKNFEYAIVLRHLHALLYFIPATFLHHPSPRFTFLARFLADCISCWTSTEMRPRGYARLEYKCDADDARSFTAALPRRISCERNRAGHSRDCVEYSFHDTLFSLFSSESPAASGDHLLFYHLTHALASRFPCINAQRTSLSRRQHDDVISQTSANGIHHTHQTYKPNITFSSGTKFISVGKIGGKTKVGIFENLFELRSVEFHIDIDD